MWLLEGVQNDVQGEIQKATTDIYDYYIGKAKQLPATVVKTVTNSNLTTAQVDAGQHAVPESENTPSRSGGAEMAAAASGTNGWKMYLPAILIGGVVVLLIMRK